MGKSSPTRLQMKDVRYGEILEAIADLNKALSYFNTQHVIECFPNIPHKIIRRKLERLIDAKIIEGCACGCSTGILVGMYQPRYEVVATYDEIKGWTDTLRPVGWRKILQNLSARQRQEFMDNVVNKIKEEFKGNHGTFDN